MRSLYLGGPTIQEVDGKMMMGLSIYGVAVISGSLYSRFYGIRAIRPSGVQFGPAKGPLDAQRANVGPASYDSKVNNITLKTATLVLCFG